MSGELIQTIVGNLASEPELRFTQSGAAVVNFTIASTPRYLDKDGTWKDGDTFWMRCSAWRTMAEHMSEMTKGTRVIAQGRLVQRQFEKDGEKRTVVEMQVEEVGPSLRFAAATVNRPERSGGQATQQRQAPTEDPWGSAPARSTGPTGGGFDSEPPF